MFISVGELSKNFRIRPNGVLHVGAHLAEEQPAYDSAAWKPVIWVEANPKLVDIIRTSNTTNQPRVILAAAWNEDFKKLNFKITSNSQASSLLDFGSIIKKYPNIVVTENLEVSTRRLDSLLTSLEMPNFLNLDVQGSELRVLQGLGDLINKLDFIYSEINTESLYKDSCLLTDLDSFLRQRGFYRLTTRWALLKGWGEALYVRKKAYEIPNHFYFLDFVSKFKFYVMFILNSIKH